jgi:hypothetical protein
MGRKSVQLWVGGIPMGKRFVAGEAVSRLTLLDGYRICTSNVGDNQSNCNEGKPRLPPPFVVGVAMSLMCLPRNGVVLN